MDIPNQPQMDQQTTPPTPPGQPQMNQPKPDKSKFLLYGIIGALVIVLAAGAVYFYTSQGPADDGNPPALSIDGTKFQGSAITTQGYYVYEASDEIAWTEPSGANMQILNRGINYFYFENPTLLDDVTTKYIKNIRGMRLMYAWYFPGDETMDRCYYTWPRGPFEGTCLLLDDHEFPEYWSLAVIASEVCEDKYDKKDPNRIILKNPCRYDANVLKDSKTQPDVFKFLDADQKGWVLLPTPSPAAVTPYTSRLTKLFIQTGPNEFGEELNFDDFSLSGGWKMVWYKATEEISAS
jgi:hypothetical protein